MNQSTPLTDNVPPTQLWRLPSGVILEYQNPNSSSQNSPVFVEEATDEVLEQVDEAAGKSQRKASGTNKSAMQSLLEQSVKVHWGPDFINEIKIASDSSREATDKSTGTTKTGAEKSKPKSIVFDAKLGTIQGVVKPSAQLLGQVGLFVVRLIPYYIIGSTIGTALLSGGESLIDRYQNPQVYEKLDGRVGQLERANLKSSAPVVINRSETSVYTSSLQHVKGLPVKVPFGILGDWLTSPAVLIGEDQTMGAGAVMSDFTLRHEDSHAMMYEKGLYPLADLLSKESASGSVEQTLLGIEQKWAQALAKHMAQQVSRVGQYKVEPKTQEEASMVQVMEYLDTLYAENFADVRTLLVGGVLAKNDKDFMKKESLSALQARIFGFSNTTVSSMWETFNGHNTVLALRFTAQFDQAQVQKLTPKELDQLAQGVATRAAFQTFLLDLKTADLLEPEIFNKVLSHYKVEPLTKKESSTLVRVSGRKSLQRIVGQDGSWRVASGVAFMAKGVQKDTTNIGYLYSGIGGMLEDAKTAQAITHLIDGEVHVEENEDSQRSTQVKASTSSIPPGNSNNTSQAAPQTTSQPSKENGEHESQSPKKTSAKFIEVRLDLETFYDEYANSKNVYIGRAVHEYLHMQFELGAKLILPKLYYKSGQVEFDTSKWTIVAPSASVGSNSSEKEAGTESRTFDDWLKSELSEQPLHTLSDAQSSALKKLIYYYQVSQEMVVDEKRAFEKINGPLNMADHKPWDLSKNADSVLPRPSGLSTLVSPKVNTSLIAASHAPASVQGTPSKPGSFR